MSSSSLEITPQPDRFYCRSGQDFIPLRGPRGREFDENAPVQLFKLCVKCKVVEEGVRELREHRHRTPGDKSIEHHKTAALLRDSYRRGCHLCTIIWKPFALNARWSSKDDEAWDEKKVSEYHDYARQRL